MSVLRTIEQKIEAIFEGIFGRAFRANVQPIELARKLVKEMDDHRLVSVSRVYVPNEYTIYLSPSDREQFASHEAALRDELQDYLAQHARREGYVVLTAPVVLFRTDEDLDLGEFGIATRMLQREPGGPGARAPEPDFPPQGEAGATMVYRLSPGATEAATPEELGVQPELVTLTLAGEAHVIGKRRIVLGRGKDCDIQVADPNVSRHHAEVRQEETAYWLVDLDSTNGTEVNGQRTKRAKLESGDRILLGSTELLFERVRQ